MPPRPMPLQYQRTIRFQDTDAAGVVYFAQVLSICHEAYEESLRGAGLDLRTFFSRGAIAVPITHAEADFRRPLHCGDRITVQLTPDTSSPQGFEMYYRVLLEDGKLAATALTRHVCIDPATRQRHPLPSALTQWLRPYCRGADAPTAPTGDD